ncbi:polysaccharide deacetylase family protein [Sphaerisporangium sp. TRM90804]|uniref:polysaccharide deacetylase family protein n=1 Tax=Sphaerisporangium sp. TRM90804 TaxID=3031113 RepID=UPI002448B505|nr:polysaccharide deacetylase family protein [Sphaerisporangium sp. TRM90804]MDH2428535.1 polysaccharide deacetylase family protein [Sphaerisporangium sp. TRM90804]
MRTTPGLTHVIGIVNIGVMIVAVVALLVLPFGREREQAGRSAGPAPAPTPSASASPSASPPAGVPPVTTNPEAARAVGANEVGMVPVLMYHRILKKRVASIDRTPRQLREELERLAAGGYVPVTAAEYVSGRIDLPAGAHPVVLTFDDGNPTHFALGADGLPKKDTAVRIILEVAGAYPGFRPVATFWINRNPFGLRDPGHQAAAVRWLVERGFEVANHTYGHPNLTRLSKKGVNEAIVRQQRLLDRLGAPRSVTFALPYGNRPRKRSTAREGRWDGTSYRFDAVFLAGAEPAISPYAKGFDPYNIPRIQSNGKKGDCRKWCSEYWLEWLDHHADRRYTSDGDPAHVSMPRRDQGKILANFSGLTVAY